MSYEIACEWARTIDPATEPLSLSEAKQQASATQPDDDALFRAYIVSARQAAESYLNRALITQTWVLQVSAWADEICLPMAAPLISVSTVKYYDSTGTQQTLSSTYYLVDTTSQPGVLRRAPNQSWPTLQGDRPRPIEITYVAGWATADDVPELIKQGMRLHVTYSDADRMGGMDSGVALRAAEMCWHASGIAYWKPPVRCRWPDPLMGY